MNLPPLPFKEDETNALIAVMMRDYGRACIEAYKASLNPSFFVRTLKGEVDWGPDCFGTSDMDILDDCPEEEGYGVIKLYQLDK